MKSLGNIRALAVAAVLVAAFAHPACAHALVLCVGDDGHVEVETSLQGSCSDSGSHGGVAPGEATIQARAADEHCGVCVDLPLVHGTTDVSTLRATARVHPAPTAVLIIAPPVAIASEARPRAADRIAFEPIHLPALRSVLLRI